MLNLPCVLQHQRQIDRGIQVDPMDVWRFRREQLGKGLRVARPGLGLVALAEIVVTQQIHRQRFCC
jgi:hypothetical protein